MLPSFSLLIKPPNALPTLRLHPHLHPHRTPTRHLHPHRTPTRTCAPTGRLPCTRAGSPKQPSRDARSTASRTPTRAKKKPPQKKPLPPKEARAERPHRAAATLHRPRAPPPAGSSAQVPRGAGAAPGTPLRAPAPAVAPRKTHFARVPLKIGSRPRDPLGKTRRTGRLPCTRALTCPCPAPAKSSSARTGRLVPQLPTAAKSGAHRAPTLHRAPALRSRRFRCLLLMPPSPAAPAAKWEGHRAPYPAPRAGRTPNGRPRPKVSNRSPRKARRRASSRWEI